MDLYHSTSEVRLDCKGRPYIFARSNMPSDTFRSATVFPNPRGDSVTCYVWWQRTVMDENGVTRLTWPDRYVFLFNQGIVVNGKKSVPWKLQDRLFWFLRDLQHAHPQVITELPLRGADL